MAPVSHRSQVTSHHILYTAYAQCCLSTYSTYVLYCTLRQSDSNMQGKWSEGHGE